MTATRTRRVSSIGRARLRHAYRGSYYTVLGAGGDLEEWFDGYEAMMTQQGIGTPGKWLITTGEEVNWFMYGQGEVSDDDLFRDDLTILMFPLEGLNVGKLASFRLGMGDRWFDDVVDNAIRGGC